MTDIEDIKKLIIAQERRFAARLCRFILHKPTLSTWMIMIPFIFIFYIQDLMKYKKGKQSFMDNFLLTRNKALAEAEAALLEKRSVDTIVIARQAKLSVEAGEKYAEFIAVLAEYYLGLFQAEGATFEDRLKAVYGGRKRYLAHIAQLSKVEKALNKSLSPELEATGEDVVDVIGSIERYSEKLRLADAKEFFA